MPINQINGEAFEISQLQGGKAAPAAAVDFSSALKLADVRSSAG